MRMTIGICTMSRGEVLQQCLSLLTHQQEYISRIIVIEDTTHSQSFSLKFLEEIFSSTEILCQYYAVSFSSISQSREFLLQKVKDGILLFLDDDVQVGRNSLREVHNFFSRSPQVGLVTGVMLPVKRSNVFSRIDSLYFNQGFLQLPKNRRLRMCPFSFVALNVSFLRKKSISISFDKQFQVGEDIDFSLRLSQLGASLIFEPRIINFHNFDTTWFSYLCKKYQHGKYIYLLFVKHQHDYLSSAETKIPLNKLLILYWIVKRARSSTQRYLLLGRLSRVEECILFSGELLSLMGFVKQGLLSRQNK